MSYTPHIGVPPQVKSPKRQPVTLDIPPEMAEKGDVDARPAAPKGPPRVGALTELEHWEREIGRVYRLVRRGQMTSTEGARLTYILTAGATTCRGKLQERREQQQLQEIERLRQQLEQLQNSRSQAALPAPAERELPEWAKDE